MKKILFFAVATLIAAVSCNKELENNGLSTPAGEGTTLVAIVDGGETKTVLNGTKPEWTVGETIRVFAGNTGYQFKNSNTENSTSAVFKCDDKIDLTDAIAVSPEVGTRDGNKITLTVNAEQTLTQDSYDPANAIAIAYAKDNNMAFKNVTSLVQFTVAYDNVTEVCVFGNNGEKISGEFTVTYDGVNEPVISEGTLTYAKVTGNLEKGKTYFISILPTEFTKGIGFEYVVKDKGKHQKKSSAVSIKRNQILDLKTVSLDKTIYFQPGSDWQLAGAKFAMWTFNGIQDEWIDLINPDTDGVYTVTIPYGNKTVHLLRMNSSHVSGINWDGVWTRYDDVTIPTDGKNKCTIANWHDLSWSTYTAE